MAGKVDFATARREAGLAVRELGFPDLFDWIDDVLSLNAALLSGWRDYTSGLHRAILDHWPAQELYRVFPPAQLIGNGTGSIAKTLSTVNHLKVDGSKLAASSMMAG